MAMVALVTALAWLEKILLRAETTHINKAKLRVNNYIARFF
jgi:hypothetical protein